MCAALTHAKSFSAAVTLAANHSGNSDSTAAICGNIVGAANGVGSIPPAWREKLELRETVEELGRDAVREFGANPPTGSDWLERYPVDPKSGYTKQIVWFDQETYRPEKNEFYDRKGDLLKTLTYKGYQQYKGKYWRPDEMFMENHQTGKSTVLLWEDYELDTGLDERDFDRNSLQRIR